MSEEISTSRRYLKALSWKDTKLGFSRLFLMDVKLRHITARKQNKVFLKQGAEDSWNYAEDCDRRLDATAWLGASQFLPSLQECSDHWRMTCAGACGVHGRRGMHMGFKPTYNGQWMVMYFVSACKSGVKLSILIQQPHVDLLYQQLMRDACGPMMEWQLTGKKGSVWKST